MSLYINQRIIKPYRGGVVLSKDESHIQAATLENIFKLPLHVFVSNLDHQILSINDLCIENCGFLSPKDAFGRTFGAVIVDKNAMLSVYDNDKTIIRCKQSRVFEEIAYMKNGVLVHTLTYKFPLYNNRMDNQIIGIFGGAVLLANRSYADIAEDINCINQLLMHTEQLKINKFKSQAKQYFSPREMDILYLLIKGGSSKSIAKTLLLSPRTVEYYIQNMKNKANVESKAQLIEKIMDNFLCEVE